MFANENLPSESIKRIQLKTALYNLLNPGFGKNIADKMSSSVVNTIAKAKELVERYYFEIDGRG